MGFAEHHDEESLRTLFAKPSDSVRSVAVPLRDSTDVATRRAVCSENGNAKSASDLQRVQKWFPLVTPLDFKVEPLPQIIVGDFFMLPLINYVLIASKHRLQQQHQWTLLDAAQLFQQFAKKELTGIKRMEIAHQQRVGFSAKTQQSLT